MHRSAWPAVLRGFASTKRSLQRPSRSGRAKPCCPHYNRIGPWGSHRVQEPMASPAPPYEDLQIFILCPSAVHLPASCGLSLLSNLFDLVIINLFDFSILIDVTRSSSTSSVRSSTTSILCCSLLLCLSCHTLLVHLRARWNTGAYAGNIHVWSRCSNITSTRTMSPCSSVYA